MSNPSAKAWEAANEIAEQMHLNPFTFDLVKVAHLIDAALADMRQAARKTINSPYPKLNELAKALAPWEPESGGGR